MRCLPSDFPTWTFTRESAPTQDWYVVTPSLGPLAANYVIFFDGNGVPVWWYKSTTPPLDAKLLSDGSVAFSNYFGGSFGTNPTSGYEVRGLDGSFRRTAATVGTATDHHDLQEIGNGNYLLMSYKPRDGVDLSPFGGPANATVVDAEVQEITPAGAVVSSWNSKDHIVLSETGRWWPGVISTAASLPDGRTVYDIVHINSVDIDGESMVLSFRHTDAVYRVDRSTGSVQWKLGGTTRAESLTPIGDPRGDNPLGGQHDARVLGDATLTVHDNGTGLGRAPRAIRYQVDTSNRTATLIESITDPEAPASGCCGSARKLNSSNWLMSWGGTSLVAEIAPNGSRVFKLAFGGPISYRAFPVPPGQVSRQALRDGMTAQKPRTSARSGGDYDGDVKTDLAVFRPGSGTWFVAQSGGGSIVGPFGVNGDVPVPADYDGDGKTDLAVFRPDSGTWFVAQSGGGSIVGPFGVNGDVPVPADYDGDGKTDLAVFRPDPSRLRSPTPSSSGGKTLTGDFWAPASSLHERREEGVGGCPPATGPRRSWRSSTATPWWRPSRSPVWLIPTSASSTPWPGFN
ncbi:MAG: aryl-sulfate sulfotransferase [Actinobacteria bacterium]|nr:aryl-sulfate sulfotransferase [Actinomycetota bacterium]